MSTKPTISSKPIYEVGWCCPLTRSLVRNAPKPAIFTELSHARAFAKLIPAQPHTFVVIRYAPIASGETLAKHAKSLESVLATVPAATDAAACKWQVVGRLPDDYTIVHMVCADGEALRFTDHARALETVEYLRTFPYSIISGVTIDAVPWKGDRVWQDGYAMTRNEFL